MADEPADSGQNDRPDVHQAPTQAWQGPGTPPPPPPTPGGHPPQAPQPPAAPRSDPHYAPTQAWQGPGTPPPPPGPQGGPQPPSAPQPPQAPQADPHAAPTQAWQGPASPPPPPGPAQPPPPQQGNYGYPQAFPQQPGPYGQAPQQGDYGYPQGMPGNYGYPQGQPGPYGQQPGYPQQPGFPQQPGHPMPPAPPGRSGGRNGLVIGIVAGAVAVLLIAGGVIVAASGDDKPGDGKKKQRTDPVELASGTFRFEPDRSVLWKVETPTAAPTAASTLIGQWTGAKNLVVGDQSALTGYDITTGKELWKAEAPVSGAAPCAMSPELTADGLGGVLFRKAGARNTSAPCTLLTVIDTATGKVKWYEDVRPGADEGRDHSIAVDEKNNRVFALTANMAFSHALDSGKKNWDAGGAKYCNLTGKVAATAVVVAQTCFDTNKTVVASLDLADGHNKSRWKYTVPGDSSAKARILSADPAVASINPGSAAARGNIVMFDSAGRPGPGVSMSQPFGKLPENTIFDTSVPYRFDGTTMVTTVGSSSAKPRTVAAFDLTTGKEKWHQDVSAQGKAVQVVGIEGGNVIAAESGDYSDVRGQLVRLQLTTGTATRGGRFPVDTAKSLDRNPVLLKGDIVFVVANYASKYTPRVTAFGPVD